ncbi:MAG: ABC transporter permease, partial [Lachnospiraceae bacterium]|nr:ABC transporter permease [Lachnospiraceae bacterium]
MKYYFVQQHDSTDCAAACLATVSLYYKKETTITKLRDMMGTDLKGTNMLGLLKCSEALGFKAQAVRVDRENFLTRFTLPAIANVVTKEGMTHFVVLFKITKRYVILSDPAKGIVKMSLEDFYKDFMGVLLILVPDEGFVKDRTDGKSVIKRYINLI